MKKTVLKMKEEKQQPIDRVLAELHSDLYGTRSLVRAITQLDKGDSEGTAYAEDVQHISSIAVDRLEEIERDIFALYERTTKPLIA